MPISSVFQVVSPDPQQVQSLVTTLNGYVTTTAASEAAAATSETNAATSETNAAASAAAALVSKNAAASSAASVGADAAAAAASAVTSQTAATSSSANAALTSADATQTAADRIQTWPDGATAADAVQTAADRVQTGLDVTSSSNSAAAALSSRNAAATSETNASASATAAAADAVSTAADAVSTAADAASTAADALATAADRVQTGLDATSASNSASAANTSASAASASQVSAAASAASAAAVFNDFEDRYYGPHASDSAAQTHVTGLGLTVDQGDLYFNSTANEMRVYDGGSWVAASSAGGASLINYNYTATASQTAFSGSDDNSNTLSYTVDNLIVTRNGVVLEDGTDYTATDGATITLSVGATSGDEINVVAFKSFTTADMVSATNGGTFQSNVTVNGTMTATAFSGDGSALTNLPAAGISDVVQDTTPQLGGNLDTNGNDIIFGDNDKAVFGAGSDLQIYHDASHSYIQEAGQGRLYVRASDGIKFDNPDSSKTGLSVFPDSAVYAYYNGSLKLATTATGVDVTGGLNTTGNVGIGTSSPADKLEIHKAVTGAYSGGVIDGGLRIDTGYSAATGSYGHNGITFYGDADNASFIYQIHNNNSTSQLAIGTNNTERMRIDSSGNAFMKTANSYIAGTTSLGFYGDAASSNGMFIDSSGNVGIGTSSPSATLTVGAPNASAVSFVSNPVASFGGGVAFDAGSGNDVQLINYRTSKMQFGTGGSVDMTIDSSGNVGIGTTNPSSYGQLTLYKGGANDTKLALANNGNGGGTVAWTLKHDTAWDLTLSHNAGIGGQNLIFGTKTSGGESMRLDTSGRLLVGNSTYTLSANGVYLDSTGSVFARNTTGGATHVNFSNPNGVVGTISTSGSSTSYNTSSDYRLKTAVNYDWDATTRLKQLKPARFEWIADGDDAVPVDGFLAHEVQDVVPEAITGTKDAMRDEEYEVTPAVLDEDGNEVTPAVMGTRSVPEYQGIDQSKLVPLLVKTIQELEARITALETA